MNSEIECTITPKPVEVDPIFFIKLVANFIEFKFHNRIKMPTMHNT